MSLIVAAIAWTLGFLAGMAFRRLHDRDPGGARENFCAIFMRQPWATSHSLRAHTVERTSPSWVRLIDALLCLQLTRLQQLTSLKLASLQLT